LIDLIEVSSPAGYQSRPRLRFLVFWRRGKESTSRTTSYFYEIDLDLGSVDQAIGDFANRFRAIKGHRLLVVFKRFDRFEEMIPEIVHCVFRHSRFSPFFVSGAAERLSK